jgi:hypothetical protein
MRAISIMALVCVVLAGCGDETPTPPEPTPVSHAWIGTFENPDGQANLVLDVVQTGEAVAGELVLEPSLTPYLPVHGSLRSGALHLEIDTRGIPYQYTLALDGHLDAASALTGQLSLSYGLNGDIVCRPLARGTTQVERSIDLSYDVVALQFDGAHLWLSTSTSDFIRLDPSGAVIDTVVVFYWPGIHWTSTALAFDGTHLWGFLPGTQSSPGGLTNFSNVIAFDAQGRLPDTFVLWHRTNGLAFHQSSFWSLRTDQPKLYRFDPHGPSGVVADSIETDVPDAYHLDSDGQNLWTTGWYMKRLYRLAADGHAELIYDLPGQETGSLQAGIAFEGTHLWYAEAHVDFTRLHRLTLSSPP